jgi:hypothetical protein
MGTAEGADVPRHALTPAGLANSEQDRAQRRRIRVDLGDQILRYGRFTHDFTRDPLDFSTPDVFGWTGRAGTIGQATL